MYFFGSLKDNNVYLYYMDLEQEIKELKMMLSQIISLVQKPEEKQQTPEEYEILKNQIENQCYEINLANGTLSEEQIKWKALYTAEHKNLSP